MKIASIERFNNLTQYSELEVESRLVSYANKNEHIEDTLHQLLIYFRGLESLLFDIRVRNEITTAPMRDHIENWLKNASTK